MTNENMTFFITARGSFRQRGASLLEGIAYLGIAAIVVLGAVSLLTGAFSSAKSNQTSEELIALRTAARKLYAGQLYPANLMLSLVPARALPSTLLIGANNTATNSWAGAVTVTGNAAGTQFTISYAGVPQDVCISVVSGSTGWVQVARAAGAGAIIAMPVTAADAATVCNDPATNTVTFTAV